MNGVVLAGMMQPLNEYAKNIDACVERMKQDDADVRTKAKEELKNWPPAPGFYEYWTGEPRPVFVRRHDTGDGKWREW
jgi:hypothetical protein